MAGCPPYQMQETRKVFIYTIPRNVTEDQVSEFLAANSIGACKLRLVQWRDSLKGYVFVKYDNFEHAAAAVESITGKEFEGQRLLAELCKQWQPIRCSRPSGEDRIDRERDVRLRARDNEEREPLSRIRPSQRSRYGRLPREHRKDLDRVMEVLRQPSKLAKGTIESLHDSTGIPLGTLKCWRKKAKNDPTWNLSRYRSDKGAPRKLTEDIEQLIYQRIRSEYVDPENYCPRKALEMLAKTVATEKGISNFEASNSWQISIYLMRSISYIESGKKFHLPMFHLVGQCLLGIKFLKINMNHKMMNMNHKMMNMNHKMMNKLSMRMSFLLVH